MIAWRGRRPHLGLAGSVRLAVATLMVVFAAGLGSLPLVQLSRAHAEVSQLSTRNVARLTVMGDIRGQQSRINDGVANMFSPGADAAKIAASKQEIARAADRMNQLMRQYRQLVHQTSAQPRFERLFADWESFYNGVHVYILGGRPLPGLTLVPGPEHLGETTVAITDGLDAEAEQERSDAAAVARREEVDYRRTLTQLAVGLAAGVLLATGTVALAIRSQAVRRRAARRFSALVQASTDVIAVIAPDGRHTYLSPSTEAVMGYSPAELVGEHFGTLLHPDDAAQVDALHAAMRADADGDVDAHADVDAHGDVDAPARARFGAREHRLELRVRHADGRWRWHEAIARNLLHDPAVRGVVINHRDITERRQFQDRLAYEASHDTLTGLANRPAFLAGLDRALAQAEAQGGRCAVIFVDLNGFKQVNDSWGHKSGDALLIGFARVLQDNVLGTDTVARLGGDEFGVVLGNIDSTANAEAVARRIIHALAEPIDTDGHPIYARASIGIALSGLSGTGGPGAEELLHRADLAMYEAKRQKINGWRCYHPGLDSQTVPAVPTVPELQAAIAGGQLRLQYQPIFSLHDHELSAVEALVRWQHPTLGLLPPETFVALADAGGLSVPLGEWVLREACAQVARWRRTFARARTLRLNVNVSPRQLDEPVLAERILSILSATGLVAGDLIIEIPEGALVNELEAIPALAALHDRGVRVAIDDFGTGYSSLRYLTGLPVDVLKLDSCFVADLDGTSKGSAVAEAVIRLGGALNIETVAEGVESAAQATELTLLGCHFAQGYHFAGPLDAADLETLLERGRQRAAS
jgi:diguanylate cyclase (GGDEF)-like protein/PAS domain S-box-containing protein